MVIATNSTHTKVVHTNVVVATNSTHVNHEVLVGTGVHAHTKVGVVHTNSIHGRCHKQYMCPSQSALQSGKQR